jgi:hypothetical protein
MTEAQNEANLNDVIETAEEAHSDRREHGKTPPRPDDEELAERTHQEQEQVDQADRD